MEDSSKEVIEEGIEERINDAIDLTIIITFLVSTFAFALAFYYCYKYNDMLSAFGIISGGIWLNLFVGDLIKQNYQK